MDLGSYIKNNGVSTDNIVFKNNIYINKKMLVNDLFLAQYMNYDFVGYDIVIMILAIENYYHLNDYGFSMYKKFFKEPLSSIISVLDNSFKINNISPIETDINFSIHKNALLLALSLFKNKRDIDIRIYNTVKNRINYNIEYLKKIFNDEEIRIIENKYQVIKNELNLPYYAIVWPPASNFVYNIKSKINGIEKGVKVLDAKIIVLTENKFKDFLYDVYQNDDIEKYKVDIKYEKLLESCKKNNININKMHIGIIKFLIEYPDYKMKVFNGNPRSKTTMRIKKIIRDDYKNYIKNYYYDIIIHSTDNIYQNEKTENLLKKIKK